MASYHDLEEQTYQTVKASPLTRIHGKPSWRAKETLKNDAKKIAIALKVSYDWSQGKGLLALIIGSARLAADYPNFPAFVEPTQPPNTPNYPQANPTGAQERAARATNDLLKRDWAVVSGFRRGMGELIREALDSKYYEDLDHMVHGYDDVSPRDFIVHLEDEWCPLDEQAIKEVREHYFRGWQHSAQPKPEGLKKFAKRLDEEQAALAADGVTISDGDKERHYLLQVYRSGIFARDTLRAWKQRAANQQTYANAKTYFEDEVKGIQELDRLTGESTGTSGFGSAAAAIESNLEALFERFNTNVEERIQVAVEDGLRRHGSITDHANAVRNLVSANDDLNRQVKDLTTTVHQLRRQLTELATSPSKDGGPGDSREAGASDKRATTFVWVDGLAFDPKWTRAKKGWFSKTLKEKEPARWREWRLAGLQKQIAALE